MSSSGSASDWAQLFKIATDLIAQVNKDQLIIDHWTFGGGTAMMLQIGHRESHDVDIFLRDPQHLPFLDPQKQDLKFEIEPSDYLGDGSRFLKIVFEGIGEIDFIVASAKTDEPTVEKEIEGVTTLLETVPEVITKKVCYRGSHIQPRDIFDIAAGAVTQENEIKAALTDYKDDVAAALKAIRGQKPEFVAGAIGALQIRDEYRSIADVAQERAIELLHSI